MSEIAKFTPAPATAAANIILSAVMRAEFTLNCSEKPEEEAMRKLVPPIAAATAIFKNL